MDDAGRVRGSMAMAPITERGICLGTLEICPGRPARQRGPHPAQLSGFRGSIALDNAHLYREVRSGSATANLCRERDRQRRARADALPLTCMRLVQLIVASYQHCKQRRHSFYARFGSGGTGTGPGRPAIAACHLEARRLISQLRPAGLDDFGLAHALRLYVASWPRNWRVSLMDPNWRSCPCPGSSDLSHRPGGDHQCAQIRRGRARTGAVAGR